MMQRLGLLTVLVVAWLGQPAAPQTPVQVYTAYRTALTEATDFPTITPYLAAAVRQQIASLPVADRARVFGLVKLASGVTQVTAITDTTLASGDVLLTVRGTDGRRLRQGTVELVREDGQWKILRETWQQTQ